MQRPIKKRSQRGEDMVGLCWRTSVHKLIKQVEDILLADFAQMALAPARQNFSREKPLVLAGRGGAQIGKMPLLIVPKNRLKHIAIVEAGLRATASLPSFRHWITAFRDRSEGGAGELARINQLELRITAESELARAPVVPVAHSPGFRGARLYDEIEAGEVRISDFAAAKCWPHLLDRTHGEDRTFAFSLECRIFTILLAKRHDDGGSFGVTRGARSGVVRERYPRCIT